MVEFDESKQKLAALRETIEEVADALDLPALETRKAELTEAQNEEGFWSDQAKSQRVNKELKQVDDKLTKVAKLRAKAEDIDVLIELAEGEEALEELPGVEEELAKLSEEAETMKIAALLKGKHDACDAILTLHAGAGGTEAQDWCSMLYRMYTRYAEKRGYSTKVLDMLPGDEAGIKTVSFEIDGDNAYGYLKAEKGVHRLVRISPFDANSRRHTSFASLEVMPVIQDETEIQIRAEDLKVDTYRSGGAGGQHVNKTESAIRITHIPTGIIVACQNERSQIQNREVAMQMLRSKLVELKEREQMEYEQSLKGDLKKIEWGSQIRSYVFCPYTLVKDHRTGYENANVQAVMDGDLQDFIVEYLKKA
ncbi:MAG: peptide chain release factor 2 [Clostridia bacterium]|nr:peptide chain release factor 2 [Clostridia bacterium]